jgi:hypothetical protein
MARKGSYRRKSHRHGRKHRGGNAPNPSSYSSATTYGNVVNGSGDSQFNRVFSQDGMDSRTQSNTIIGAQGQNSGLPATLAQRAGSRRKRGGFFGEVINQAIVPIGILGLQQTYGKKRSGGRKTRRHRRR